MLITLICYISIAKCNLCYKNIIRTRYSSLSLIHKKAIPQIVRFYSAQQTPYVNIQVVEKTDFPLSENSAWYNIGSMGT